VLVPSVARLGQVRVSIRRHATVRQLSDEEVTVIGFALLCVTGNDAITWQIRDEATAYLGASPGRFAYW
jgi:hypothetical protein